jgi:predicted metal-binding protein
MQLSDAKKREHTLFVCKGCHQNFVKAQWGEVSTIKS